jgi:hypothetical protein
MDNCYTINQAYEMEVWFLVWGTMWWSRLTTC